MDQAWTSQAEVGCKSHEQGHVKGVQFSVSGAIGAEGSLEQLRKEQLAAWPLRTC